MERKAASEWMDGWMDAGWMDGPEATCTLSGPDPSPHKRCAADAEGQGYKKDVKTYPLAMNGLNSGRQSGHNVTVIFANSDTSLNSSSHGCSDTPVNPRVLLVSSVAINSEY